MSPIPSFEFTLPANQLYDDHSQQSFPANMFPTVPPMQWSTSNTSLGINQYIQRIQVLEDTIMKLQVENAMLEARSSTIQKSYDTLVSQLNRISNTSTDTSSHPIGVALQPPTPSDTPAPPQFKAEDYPCIRFGTEKDWKDWNETAKGQKSKQEDKFHNTRYLENTDGERLDAAHITNILNCMQDIWHGFRRQNLIDASTTWTSMSLPLKKLLRAEMAKSHPETNLGKDGWKMDRLAKDHYPSFKQTWFTNKTEEKRAGKRKIKSEGNSDSSSVANQESSERKAKRTKHESVLSEADSDAISGGSRKSTTPSSPNDDSTPTGGSDNDVISLRSSNDAISVRSSTDNIIPLAADPSDDNIIPLAADPSDDRLSVSASDIVAVDARPSGSLPPMADMDDNKLLGPISESLAIADPSTTTAPVTTKDDPAPRPTVQIKNPLLSGLSKARRSSPEPSQTPSTSMSTLNGPTPQIEEGPRPGSTSAATTPCHDGANNNSVTERNPSVDVGSSTPKLLIRIPGVTASGTGKVGWRPPSNKTGRTLCAHRWLKQIKSNGSKEDFDAYYQTLSAESKARYKDEAAKLIADHIWTKGTTEVIAKIAVLPMH